MLQSFDTTMQEDKYDAMQNNNLSQKYLTKNKKVRRLNAHNNMISPARYFCGVASHNYILSEIEALKKCLQHKGNNIVGKCYHIFFCLNFG